MQSLVESDNRSPALHFDFGSFAPRENVSARKRKNAARAVGAVLAIALQAAFLAVLIWSTQTNGSRPASPEITLLLQQVQEQPVVVQLPDIEGLQSLKLPSFRPLSKLTTRRAAIWPVPRVFRGPVTGGAGLNISLFKCSLENSANLSAEERAACAWSGGTITPEQPDVLGARSHVEDNMRWANALAHERSPLVLPCMGGLDVLCVLRNVAGLADGSTLDPESSLRDPEQWGTYVDPGEFAPRDPGSAGSPAPSTK